MSRIALSTGLKNRRSVTSDSDLSHKFVDGLFPQGSRLLAKGEEGMRAERFWVIRGKTGHAGSCPGTRPMVGLRSATGGRSMPPRR